MHARYETCVPETRGMFRRGEVCYRNKDNNKIQDPQHVVLNPE